MINTITVEIGCSEFRDIFEDYVHEQKFCWVSFGSSLHSKFIFLTCTIYAEYYIIEMYDIQTVDER